MAVFTTKITTYAFLSETVLFSLATFVRALVGALVPLQLRRRVDFWDIGLVLQAYCGAGGIKSKEQTNQLGPPQCRHLRLVRIKNVNDPYLCAE